MATLRRGSGRWTAVGLVLVAVLFVAVAGITSREPARASDVGIVSPARATASATRGQQVRVGPTPNEAGCRRVVVIGDSLTDNGRWYLQEALDGAGFVHLIDAQHSRRVPASVSAPFSGVIAARQVRSTWGEADCWVIALGSNDLIFGAGDPGVAAQLIESMLAATTPSARVWWVNLDYHRDPAVAFDFVGATSRFNATLTQRAAIDPDLTVIDWYSLAEAHLEWFFDAVHVDAAGSRARARQVADALPR